MLISRRVLAAILLSSSYRSSSALSATTFGSTCRLHPTIRSSPSILSTTRPFLARTSQSTVRAMSDKTDATSQEHRQEQQQQVDDDICANLDRVRHRIAAACEQASRPTDSVRLVAVSKTQPLTALRAAYEHGNQRVFGENYVQELIDKVQHFHGVGDDSSSSSSITWHFIGALQSNKVNSLVSAFSNIDQLVVETVSSEKLANKLNTAVAAATAKANDDTAKLKIYIQVNTSGEDSKSGISADKDTVVGLCRHVAQNCPHLVLQGLMTIGAPGDASAFDILRECRNAVQRELDIGGGSSNNTLELSMGMSGDFETAIAKGATNVRVGSTIFGARDYSNKK